MTDQNPTRRSDRGLPAGRREPLDPGRKQEVYDVSDWDDSLCDDLSDELDNHDVVHEWDHGLLTFYVADQRRVDEVLSRFVAAHEADGRRVPNPFVDSDG